MGILGGFKMYYGDEIRDKLTIYNHKGDRCACGASAVSTGIDGYCFECSEKRDSFINDIIGNIDIEYLYKIAGFRSSEIKIIEEFRKLLLGRELLGLIDIHFASHNRYNHNFTEPYENPSFLSLVNEKTQHLMQIFLSELEQHSLNMPTLDNINLLMISSAESINRKKLNKAFLEYQLLLKKQMKIDEDNIQKLINVSFSGSVAGKDKILNLVKIYRTKYNK